MYRKPSADVSRRTLSVEEIRKCRTFGDPVRMNQNLTGAARSPFGSGLLVIRGAILRIVVYVDELDPLIYHLGSYVSVLNADLIDSVDYLRELRSSIWSKSCGVVDVKTKNPGAEQACLGVPMWLDSGGLIQGRLKCGHRSRRTAFLR